MDSVRTLFGTLGDVQKKIVLAAGAIIVLMVLFPPKVIFNTNPVLNVTQSQSAGYQFLLSDPAGEQKQAARALLGDEVDKYIGSHIEWGKLLLQIVIVAVITVVAIRFVANQQPQGARGNSA